MGWPKGKPRKAVKTAGPRPIMSNSEVERIRGLISEDEGYLKGLDTGPTETEAGPMQVSQGVDKDGIMRRINRNKRALDALAPKQASTKESNKLHAQMKTDEEWLRKHMMTRKMMDAFPSTNDPVKESNYQQAVKKAVQDEVGNPEFGIVARRYKDAARQVDPSDPELCNIERLRAN